MDENKRPAPIKILWIYPGSLHVNLDAATWLETTKCLRSMDYQVTLIHAGPEDLTDINGVEITSIPKPKVYLIRQAIFHFQVYFEIAKDWRNIDVILFHHMSLLWMIPWRFMRISSRRSRPIFVKDTRTAPMIPREIAARRDRFRTVFDNVVNRLANNLADGQTAITYRMAEMMHIRHDQLLGVWPSGVNLDTFASAAENRDWGELSSCVKIIYIGAMHYQRNLMNFCRAVELANRDNMRFTLTLIGAGTEYDDLKAFALDTDAQIRVLSPVPHDEIPTLLAQAHIGVLPFPDQERFQVSSPIKLFEYMASGMPILATNLACHTDVVGDGTFAFWANNENVDGLLESLESVWEQRFLLPRKGEEAAAAAHEWTWSASAQKLNKAMLEGLSDSNIAGRTAERFG